MLTTGNQLKAARALVGLSQGDLAGRARVNINTISSMEKQGAETLTSGLDVVTRVAQALEVLGIEFIDHGEPGVRLRKSGASALVGAKGASRKNAAVKTDAVKPRRTTRRTKAP
jgi:transcriptional regulator with XRE-family HTH domain